MSSAPTTPPTAQAAVEYIQKRLSPDTPLHLASNFLNLERTQVCLHFLTAGPSLDTCKGVLLFVHGWPDFFFGWRHQIAFFAAQGYRCIAPDLRGFGSTTLIGKKHISPEDYTYQLVCKDLEQLLVHSGIHRVVVIGHDWGGGIAWSFARRYPSLCAGVVALCTPYRPAKSTYVSPEEIAALMPVFAYQVFFKNHRKEAAAELDSNPSRTISCLFRTGDKKDQIGAFMTSAQTKFLANFPQNPRRSPLMTEEEHALYTQMFTVSGFEPGLCWYGTSRANWETENWEWKDEQFDVRSPSFINFRANESSSHPDDSLLRKLPAQMHTPALMVTAGNDHVLKPSMTVGMETWCENLKRLHVEGAAHWLQMEKPNKVNQGMIAFIAQLPKWVNEPVKIASAAPTPTPASAAPKPSRSQPKSKL